MPVAAAACLLTVIAWAYLAGCHGGYWRTDQWLPAGQHDPAGQHEPAGQHDPAGQHHPAAWPAVTAVIPARDEAAVLPGTLPALLSPGLPGNAARRAGR